MASDDTSWALPLPPSRRVVLIKRLGDLMSGEDRIDIDLTLEQFGFRTYPNWQDPPNRTYVIEVLKEGPDEALVTLAEHYGLRDQQEQETPPPDDALERIWQGGKFRLFISHIHPHKELAANLSAQLREFEVAGFVAHEHIRPSLEWQREIERALASMHALVALVTPGFRDSKWTDQEVGWALGRRILVLPVRMGEDPYGFFGRNQGIQGAGVEPAVLAERIFDALALNALTQERVGEAAVEVFSLSPSYRRAEQNAERLLNLSHLSSEQLRRIEKACVGNRQISDAHACPAIIRRLFAKHQWKPGRLPEEW